MKLQQPLSYCVFVVKNTAFKRALGIFKNVIFAFAHLIEPQSMLLLLLHTIGQRMNK